MGFKIEGLTEFENKLIEMIDEKYPEMVNGLVSELGDRLVAKVKKKTPVDSGNLKRTWEKSDLERTGKSVSVTVFNNTEYAQYVEYGYRRKKHFVPGYWKNGKFVYDKSAKGGMIVSSGRVPGVFMLKRSVEELNKETTKIVKNWLIKTLKELKL